MVGISLEGKVRNSSQHRTRSQTKQDIANSIYAFGGKAVRYRIILNARLRGPFAAYIDQMVDEGYLERTTVKTKMGYREGYQLTAEGRKSFPEQAHAGYLQAELQDQDKWFVLPELAKNGARKTELIGAIGTSNVFINRYLSLLLKYGVLAKSGHQFFSTPLYEQMEKMALLYALDVLFALEPERHIKPPRLQELEMLLQMTQLIEPVSSSRLKDSIPVKRSSDDHKRLLDRLLAKGYAMGLKDGTRIKYQITGEGSGLLARIDETVRLLKASRQPAAV